MSKCKDAAMAKEAKGFQAHMTSISKRLTKVTESLTTSEKKVCDLKIVELKTFYWEVRKEVKEYMSLWRLSNVVLRTLGEKASKDENSGEESEEDSYEMDD